MNERLTVEHAARLLVSSTKEFVKVLEHCSLEVEYYRPIKTDRQQPHDRDEVYVIVSGSGIFATGDVRQPFEQGEVLFVPAGVSHRFEDFTDDFATWVLFYGPAGGEGDAS